MATFSNLDAHKFPQGKSGNPNGRPKGARSLKTMIQEVLDLTVEVPDKLSGDGSTIQLRVDEAIIRSVAAKAIKGNLQAAKALWDRLEGRPTLPIGPADPDTEVILSITRKVVTRDEQGNPHVPALPATNPQDDQADTEAQEGE